MTEAGLLLDSLPGSFDFYGLGTISPGPQAPGLVAAELQGIGFSLQGEARGLVAVLFDAALDRSIYAEAGNVLASRLADGLAREGGRQVLISSPLPLKSERIAEALAKAGPERRRTYWHFHGSRAARLEIIWLDHAQEITAHV